MCKIPAELLNSWDTVVVDETHTCLASSISKTNQSNLADNDQRFKFLLQNADNVILLCAELGIDNMVRDFIEDKLPNSNLNIMLYKGTNYTFLYDIIYTV